MISLDGGDFTLSGRWPPNKALCAGAMSHYLGVRERRTGAIAAARKAQ
jgi:hypothetical protein